MIIIGGAVSRTNGDQKGNKGEMTKKVKRCDCKKRDKHGGRIDEEGFEDVNGNDRKPHSRFIIELNSLTDDRARDDDEDGNIGVQTKTQTTATKILSPRQMVFSNASKSTHNIKILRSQINYSNLKLQSR